MRKLKAITSVMGFVWLIGLSAPLTYGDTAAAGTGTDTKAIGNETCPVTGEKIEKQSEVTFEYKGKVYNFCCMGCIAEFKANPEKYIGRIK